MSLEPVNVDNADPTYVEGDGGHLVGLAAGVYERIEQWLAVLTQRSLDRNVKYPDLATTYSINPLRRYVRIVEAHGSSPIGGRSVHAFVDPTNGDVYKSAGWAKPAKHVRFNLLDDESFARMIATCDPYGGYLYLR